MHLLSAEEELTLARLVQRRERLLEQQGDGDLPRWADRCQLSPAELRLALHQGRRAKERMIQANLRLVVAVAKKYLQRGMELLDLVQEGTLGLERAVERFDPPAASASAPTPTGGSARASTGGLPARAAPSAFPSTSPKSSTASGGPSGCSPPASAAVPPSGR